MKSSGTVRPMQDADFPQLLALYEHVSGSPKGTTKEQLASHLKRVFIEHPWRDDAVPSLVVEQDDGSLCGCLGVVPRPMIFAGKQILSATSHSFLMSPESRAGLSAIELVRVFLSGPQELSLCQGESASARIWQLFGGQVSQIYSLCWVRSLRPARHALSFLSRRGVPELFTVLLRPFGMAADAVALRLAPAAFNFRSPGLKVTELDVEQLPATLSRIFNGKQLHPSYNADNLTWLLDTLQMNPARGTLRKVMVCDGPDILGWYLYFLRGAIADVAQIAATRNTMSRVFDHLLWQAHQDGAAAASGQVDPVLFDSLNERGCLLRNPEPRWLLMHSRNSALPTAINNGQAFLSRMDAEWWISELLR
jgi:hypothetical protein